MGKGASTCASTCATPLSQSVLEPFGAMPDFQGRRSGDQNFCFLSGSGEAGFGEVPSVWAVGSNQMTAPDRETRGLQSQRHARPLRRSHARDPLQRRPTAWRSRGQSRGGENVWGGGWTARPRSAPRPAPLGALPGRLRDSSLSPNRRGAGSGRLPRSSGKGGRRGNGAPIERSVAGTPGALCGQLRENPPHRRGAGRASGRKREESRLRFSGEHLRSLRISQVLRQGRHQTRECAGARQEEEEE